MRVSKICILQPGKPFLVAPFFSALALAVVCTNASAQETLAEPNEASRYYFFAGASHSENMARPWSESETRIAAEQAESVVRLAAGRIEGALKAGDSSYFLRSGNEYIQREWPLAAAEQVPYAFARQTMEFKSTVISPYGACGKAGKALGDWYHFYRSNLSNGQQLAALMDTPQAKEAASGLWTRLSECKKSL